jgi:hypothetical protein
MRALLRKLLNISGAVDAILLASGNPDLPV